MISEVTVFLHSLTFRNNSIAAFIVNEYVKVYDFARVTPHDGKTKIV